LGITGVAKDRTKLDRWHNIAISLIDPQLGKITCYPPTIRAELYINYFQPVKHFDELKNPEVLEREKALHDELGRLSKQQSEAL